MMIFLLLGFWKKNVLPNKIFVPPKNIFVCPKSIFVPAKNNFVLLNNICSAVKKMFFHILVMSKEQKKCKQRTSTKDSLQQNKLVWGRQLMRNILFWRGTNFTDTYPYFWYFLMFFVPCSSYFGLFDTGLTCEAKCLEKTNSLEFSIFQQVDSNPPI